LERDSRDHAKTLTEIISSHAALAGRVAVLEHAHNERLVLEARQEERATARIEWQDRIEKEIQTIRGVGTKLLWIIGTGVIGAFVAFFVNRGLGS
jgi:hypothetical protein